MIKQGKKHSWYKLHTWREAYLTIMMPFTTACRKSRNQQQYYTLFPWNSSLNNSSFEWPNCLLSRNQICMELWFKASLRKRMHLYKLNNMAEEIQFIQDTVTVDPFQYGWKHGTIMSTSFINNEFHLSRTGNKKTI